MCALRNFPGPAYACFFIVNAFNLYFHDPKGANEIQSNAIKFTIVFTNTKRALET